MRRICGNCGWYVREEQRCGKKVAYMQLGYGYMDSKIVVRTVSTHAFSDCLLCHGKYFVFKRGEKIE